MRLFDLHCDTVYECVCGNKSLSRNDLHLDLERGTRYSDWVQTFAFWVPDELPEEEQYALYQKELATFRAFEAADHRLTPFDGKPKQGKCNYLLSVEGGGLLGDQPERLQNLKQDGITFLTLTWNRANRIGGGALSDQGLTPYGREVVALAEQSGLILDASHLNRTSFEGLCEVAKRPFVATHSNADAICPHPRNLTESQIKAITERGGLIGLNLYHAFISPEKDADIADFLRHIEYFLTAGAESSLAIGTDFDGATLPKWINGIEGLEILSGFVVKWFGETVCNRIFYENAARFYRDVILSDML